jgi:hypothetical protein
MPRSRQYLQSGCASSWCRRIRAQRRELYHAFHFVGWPRIPMILSPSADALDGLQSTLQSMLDCTPSLVNIATSATCVRNSDGNDHSPVCCCRQDYGASHTPAIAGSPSRDRLSASSFAERHISGHSSAAHNRLVAGSSPPSPTTQSDVCGGFPDAQQRTANWPAFARAPCLCPSRDWCCSPFWCLRLWPWKSRFRETDTEFGRDTVRMFGSCEKPAGYSPLRCDPRSLLRAGDWTR